jgi:FkbH-like protein
MPEAELTVARPEGRVTPGKAVKLVVWDLDDTIWRGVLLEGGGDEAIEPIIDVIRRLDARGVLHSIASRNDEALALRRLEELGLAEYFLAPQFTWDRKSEAVQRIAERLNLGLDAVLFVDDQPFEREEVASALPHVRTLAADLAAGLADDPLLTPTVVTDEARRRRASYREDEARQDYERAFTGSNETFLHTLELSLCVADAAPADLLRAEELVLRTNQLNSTGVVYSARELEALCASTEHRVLMADLSDRFGDYGKIGLVVLRTCASVWRLKLLLVSCRVQSRGAGAVLLSHLIAQARAADAQFEADFRNTGRNRPMQIAYRFAGLRELRRDGDIQVYGPPSDVVGQIPPYYRLTSMLS